MDDKVECSVCHHGFGDSTLKVCKHPILDVPTCVICHDMFNEKWVNADQNDSGGKDICSWCGGDECGHLFICGDGATCPHSFCEECIKENLGVEKLKEIDEIQEWICLKCEQGPLKDLQESLERGLANSIYRDWNKKVLESSLELYEVVVARIGVVNQMLEHENVAKVMLEVENEAASKYEFYIF